MKEERVTDRILQYAVYKGISASAFEKSIGKAPSYLRNTKDVTTSVLLKLVEIYPDINMQWVISGKGSMLKPSSYNQGINNEIKGSFTGSTFVGGDNNSTNYQGNFEGPINTEIGYGFDKSKKGNDKLDDIRLKKENAILKTENESLKVENAILKAKIEEKDRFIKMLLERN